jgi:glycine cleavage system H protein
VVAVNDALADAPELVWREPYGRGWLARLQPSAWADDCAALLHEPAAVAEAMRHHAWLHREEGQA